MVLNVRYARKAPIQARTIMVAELPKKVKSSEGLYRYIAEMYSPSTILNAILAPKMPAIRDKKEDRKDLLDDWRYANSFFREKGIRPTER